MRRRLSILFLLLVVACESHDHTQGTTVPKISFYDWKTLNRGLPGEPETLDPQRADDTYSFQVIRDMYEGLTGEDRSGKTVPAAAKSWVVDPKGTTYTFQIRTGARWSDGTPVVAEEFVSGLRKAVDPKTASGSATLLSAIKGASEIIAGKKPPSALGVASIGESRVQIVLEHPAPYFLEILSQPIAAPVHLIAQPALVGNQERLRTATNGPYMLVGHVPGSYIELARNPHYWNARQVSIAKVRYVNSESEATELRKYIAGQLDLTFTIPTSDLERVLAAHHAEVQVEPFLATLYLAVNLSSGPLSNSVGLRQALSMSLDRDLIARKIVNGATPAYSLVARGVSSYKLADYTWASLDRQQQLTKARDLYAKSGYSKKNPLHLKLYFNQDEGVHRLMVAVAGSWKQNLGVETEFISDEFRVFLVGRKDKSRWDVARLGWTADYDDASSFLNVFARNSAQNDPGYGSDTFNRFIESAELESNSDQRAELLHEAEEIFLEDYPIIPIYFYQARRLVKPYVGGAQLTTMNRTYTKDLFWRSAP